MAWFEDHPEGIKNPYVVAKQAVNTYVKYKVFIPMFIGRNICISTICSWNTKTSLTDDFNRFSSPTGNPEDR